MSFTKYNEFVSEGDTVVIFIGYQNLLAFTVDGNKVHQTKYGALPHKNLIGLRYGSKIQCARGYCYLLHPTPELWTITLPHRTQILYSTDISLILFQLDIKPGSVVIEAGTGSGSLSHAIMKSIYPSGHLHTFDFHEDRANAARKEFQRHDCASVVSVQHKDVCKDGFNLINAADAVFLDLPMPWEALESAKTALKDEGGRICTFSPCIEQVQRSCERMRELKFVDIQMLECLQRPFEIREVAMPDIINFPDNSVDMEMTTNTAKRKKTVASISEKSGTENVHENEIKHKNQNTNYNDKKCEEQQKNGTRTISFIASVAPKQMPGHTGYLVFATKPPH